MNEDIELEMQRVLGDDHLNVEVTPVQILAKPSTSKSEELPVPTDAHLPAKDRLVSSTQLYVGANGEMMDARTELMSLNV